MGIKDEILGDFVVLYDYIVRLYDVQRDRNYVIF